MKTAEKKQTAFSQALLMRKKTLDYDQTVEWRLENAPVREVGFQESAQDVPECQILSGKEIYYPLGASRAWEGAAKAAAAAAAETTKSKQNKSKKAGVSAG